MNRNHNFFVITTWVDETYNSDCNSHNILFHPRQFRSHLDFFPVRYVCPLTMAIQSKKAYIFIIVIIFVVLTFLFYIFLLRCCSTVEHLRKILNTCIGFYTYLYKIVIGIFIIVVYLSNIDSWG